MRYLTVFLLCFFFPPLGGFASVRAFDFLEATHLVDLRQGSSLSARVSVIWGVSTGEKGEKYAIAPSFKLGLLYGIRSWGKGRLTIKAYHVFSGALREKTCSADYGEIAGVREVNCRLAASPMAPEETLRFNFNEKPEDRNFISIEYRKEF
ncbi:hypothetical protein ACLIIZ_05945 [Azonexus caeni]|uniref:hypothetical protein n=1 Tax=Azonexus caeni TaxID=266126 RepID=UPI003A8434A3